MDKFERSFPDLEIEGSLDSFGGWLNWIGNGTEPNYAITAMRWMVGQGDDLPEDLVELRDVLVSFGLPPHEEAVARVRGLEEAFGEIADILKGVSGNTGEFQRLREIVDSCVKYSGAFDTQEPDEKDEKGA